VTVTFDPNALPSLPGILFLNLRGGWGQLLAYSAEWLAS
jgi:hypothetical protein